MPTGPGAAIALRSRAYSYLEPRAWPGTGLSPVNVGVCILIAISSSFAILETEEGFVTANPTLVSIAETVFAVIFLMEYGARLWVSAEDPRYGDGLMGRVRYALTPAAIVDLLAVLPFLLAIGGSEVFLLRLFRLIRVMRLARLGRFSRAIAHISEAIRSRGPELLLSFAAATFLLIVSSSFLYLVEGGEQPKEFGSIPRAMWWSVVTLTTVGYGDVYPVTVLGRMFAAVTAIAGIGLIAMPTGILAAAFSEAMQNETRQKDDA